MFCVSGEILNLELDLKEILAVLKSVNEMNQ